MAAYASLRRFRRHLVGCIDGAAGSSSRCAGRVQVRSQTFSAICSAVLAGWAAGVIDPAAAQDAAPLTMTIGFGAGERPDLYGRILGRSLVRFLPGTPGLLVLNKPGAGGVIALNEWVSKAEPNGLHVTVGGSSQIDMDAL